MLLFTGRHFYVHVCMIVGGDVSLFVSLFFIIIIIITTVIFLTDSSHTGFTTKKKACFPQSSFNRHGALGKKQKTKNKKPKKNTRILVTSFPHGQQPQSCQLRTSTQQEVTEFLILSVQLLVLFFVSVKDKSSRQRINNLICHTGNGMKIFRPSIQNISCHPLRPQSMQFVLFCFFFFFTSCSRFCN